MTYVVTTAGAKTRQEYKPIYESTKRAIDLLLCFLLLPFSLLILSVCAILIRLDSPGPVIFIQKRIGRDGRIFNLLKFRTLHRNVDEKAHREFMKAFIRGENGSGPDGANPDGHLSVCSVEGSNGTEYLNKPIRADEITRVGRILRKTSLDELPQIFNVITGDMSLIGPRPFVPWEVEEFKDWQLQRLYVPQGITGLAQVRGRSNLSFEQIIQNDIEYVENRGLALDMEILWQTVLQIFQGWGAG